MYSELQTPRVMAGSELGAKMKKCLEPLTSLQKEINNTESTRDEVSSAVSIQMGTRAT